jgi:hypothetical protein
MSTGNKSFQLVEEIPTSPKNKNKNGIIIELPNKKPDEDNKSENSAEFSGKEMNPNNQNIINIQGVQEIPKNIKPIILPPKAYEKYMDNLRDQSMRYEIEKVYNETERLKKKYEEKKSHLHSFDNNPQFQKMLKTVDKQLKYFFIEGIFLNIFSALLYFYITRRKEGLALSSFCVSVSEIAICIILFIALRLGLLNDPNLSKAFRLFVVMESLLIFTSFIINVIAGVIFRYYFKKNVEFIVRIIIYIIFAIMILISIFIFKFCLNLFVESTLILLKRKTEYSILMLNEQNMKNDMNFSINVSTTSNNVTTEGLNNNSTNIFNIDNNKEENKEEEKFKALNFYNTFHYSNTSARDHDYIIFKKN